MSITPNLMLQIRQQTAQLLQDRTSNQQSNQDEIAKSAKEVIDQVPVVMAQTLADGGSYAEIMTLREGRDYTCDSWKDSLFAKGPSESRLKGAAAAVFAWCQESGLQPFLAPYRGLSKAESRMVIQWETAHLCAGLNADASFMQKLQAVTAEAQAQEAANRYRERVKTVRQTIADMHKRIAEYSKKGWTSASVGYATTGAEKSNLRNDSWTGDVIAYCEGIGLKIEISTEKSCEMSLHDLWTHSISVTWDAGTTPGK